SGILKAVVSTAAVHTVTNDRMLEPRKVHSDLMSSSRFDFHIEQGEATELPPNIVDRERRPAATNHRHAGAIASIASDGLVDLSNLLFHDSMNQSNVRLKDFAFA